MTTLHPLNLIQLPSLRWGFVGRVPESLAYVDAVTGEAPTPEQIKRAHHVGPRMAGVKTRSWETRTSAEESARAYGYVVAPT